MLKSWILLGLRGTGKTVLLNKIKRLTESMPYAVSLIEAPENGALANLLYPKINQVLRRLSALEKARAHTYAAMQALRNFASALNVSIGDVTISVDPKPGTADSGNLEFDLSDLFTKVGEAAKSAGHAWVLLMD